MPFVLLLAFILYGISSQASVMISLRLTDDSGGTLSRVRDTNTGPSGTDFLLEVRASDVSELATYSQRVIFDSRLVRYRPGVYQNALSSGFGKDSGVLVVNHTHSDEGAESWLDVSGSGARGQMGESPLFFLAFDVMAESGTGGFSIRDNPHSTAPFADALTNPIPHAHPEEPARYLIGDTLESALGGITNPDTPSEIVSTSEDPILVALSNNARLSLPEFQAALKGYPGFVESPEEDRSSQMERIAESMILGKSIFTDIQIHADPNLMKVWTRAYQDAASREAMKRLMERLDRGQGSLPVDDQLIQMLDSEYPCAPNIDGLDAGTLKPGEALCTVTGKDIYVWEFLEYADMDIKDTSSVERPHLERTVKLFLLKRRALLYAETHLLQPESETQVRCLWHMAYPSLVLQVTRNRLQEIWYTVDADWFASLRSRHPGLLGNLAFEDIQNNREQVLDHLLPILIEEIRRELLTQYGIRVLKDHLSEI